MSDRVALKRTATVGRLAIAGMTAAFLGGCSSDALRMESFSSPLAGLSNPFSGLMGGGDATGSITPPSRTIPSRAAAPAPSSGFTAPSFSSASAIQKFQPPVGGPATGWSAAGGTPVVVANGESLSVLSQRYGVPEQALLNANGFSSASQIAPGTRLTIPVYNAGSGGSVASRALPAVTAPKVDAKPLASAPVAPKTFGSRSLVAEEQGGASSRLDEERAKLAKARAEAAQAKAELEAEKKKIAVEKRRAETASLSAQTHDAKAAKARAEAERAELKARRERLSKLQADEADKRAKLAVANAQVKKQVKVEEKAKIAAARDAGKSTTKSETKTVAAADAKKIEADKKADALKKAEAVKKAEADRKAKAEADRKLAEAKAAEKAAKVAKVEAPKEAVVEESVKAKSEPVTTASVRADEKTASSGNPEFRWPARGRIIQGFRTNGNAGIDIAVPEGTPVKAAESGVVAYAGSELKNLGNLVLIRHPNGYVSAYAHNGDLDVKRGDQVKRGQTIARSGQTGAVQSPMLHFELRKGSTPVDPTQYLAGL
jgi:murein DD-endopeptidase MepM/ murein hydrolase activator NlpD